MNDKDFLTVEDFIDQEIDEKYRQQINQLLDYLINVVRGKKIRVIRGSYIIPEEYSSIPEPEIINNALDEIMDKMRTFKLPKQSLDP